MNSNQYVKHYTGDWAKDKSRMVVKNTLESTLLTFRKPKDLNVLCFPGIDAKEITDIYDPLGIPRKNIIGIECDKRVADELERKNLGIQLVRGKVEDYLSHQKTLSLDVVSLDYTQPVHETELDMIYDMLLKQQRGTFILHVANSVKRDSQSDSIYKSGLLGFDISILQKDGIEQEKYFQSVLRVAESYHEKQQVQESRVEEKAHAFSKIIRSLYGGIIQRDSTYLASFKKFDKLVKFLAGDDLFHVVEEVVDREAKSYDLSVNFNREHPITCLGEEGLSAHIGMNLVEYLAKVRCSQLPIPHHSHLSVEFHRLLTTSVKEKSFFVNLAERTYSYISESGCPMVGDIYLLQRPIRVIEAASRSTPLIGFPTRFNVSNIRQFARAFTDFMMETMKLHTLRIKYNGQQEHNPRVFLGNASKPVLSKQRFIEELDAGNGIEYIKQTYRGWTNKPLSQWKSNHTFGTYRAPEKIALEAVLEDPEDADIEKITKDEAIQYLLTGMPYEDIQRMHPTSFTLGQLRAFQAHITRGTYKNGETEEKT